MSKHGNKKLWPMIIHMYMCKYIVRGYWIFEHITTCNERRNTCQSVTMDTWKSSRSTSGFSILYIPILCTWICVHSDTWFWKYKEICSSVKLNMFMKSNLEIIEILAQWKLFKLCKLATLRAIMPQFLVTHVLVTCTWISLNCQP